MILNSVHSPKTARLEPFDVNRVLEALRAPLAALNRFVEISGDQPRIILPGRVSGTNLASPDTSISQVRVNDKAESAASSKVSASSTNPRKTLQDILKEFSPSVEPLESDKFFSTVTQLEKALADDKSKSGFSEMMINQLKKWYKERENDDNTSNPYKQLRRDLRVGMIFNFAKQIVQGNSQDCELMKQLVGVLNFIGGEISKDSPVQFSLVKEFKQASNYSQGGKWNIGHGVHPLLEDRLGDRNLAEQDQHHVNIFLKDARNFRNLYREEGPALSNEAINGLSRSSRMLQWFNRKVF